MKKLLSLLLCLMLCMSLMPMAVAEEPDHITVGLGSLASVIDYETNAMTLALEKEGNFDLEFVTFTAKEMLEKVNVMIQAGGDDLPDVLLFCSTTGRPSNSAIYSWAMNGAIIPITDYIKNKEVSPNFNTSMVKSGTDLLPMITMPDGEIYHLPGYARSIGNEYQHKNWIYQPWLDKLGLEKPTDAESLYNVLKAFKEQDPNGNGQADEIPLMSYAGGSNAFLRSLMSMFVDVGNTSDWIAVKDGQLQASYVSEEYREGLRYLKKLVDEDLLSPLTFTQDEAQFKAILAQEDVVVGMSVKPSLASSIDASSNRRAEYTHVPPLAMADGTVITPYTPTTPSAHFVITAGCKNPDAAFRLGDLLCSEKYTVWNRWGEKDVDWVVPEEGSVAMYASLGYAPYLKETGNIVWGSPQNQAWNQQGPYVRGYEIPAGMVWNGNPLDSEYIIATAMPDYIGKGPAEYISTLIYTEEENEIIAEPLTTINSYVAEARAQFITGDLDIEADWDAYLNELYNNELAAVLEVMQAAYDRNN